MKILLNSFWKYIYSKLFETYHDPMYKYFVQLIKNKELPQTLRYEITKRMPFPARIDNELRIWDLRNHRFAVGRLEYSLGDVCYISCDNRAFLLSDFLNSLFQDIDELYILLEKNKLTDG